MPNDGDAQVACSAVIAFVLKYDVYCIMQRYAVGLRALLQF